MISFCKNSQYTLGLKKKYFVSPYILSFLVGILHFYLPVPKGSLEYLVHLCIVIVGCPYSHLLWSVTSIGTRCIFLKYWRLICTFNNLCLFYKLFYKLFSCTIGSLPFCGLLANIKIKVLFCSGATTHIWNLSRIKLSIWYFQHCQLAVWLCEPIILSLICVENTFT